MAGADRATDGKERPQGKAAGVRQGYMARPDRQLFHRRCGARECVFAAAGDGEDFLTRGRICEANFYVGEWRLQHHDPAAAQPMIRKAADDCPMDFVE